MPNKKIILQSSTLIDQQTTPGQLIDLLLANRSLKSQAQINNFLKPPHPKTFTPASLQLSSSQFRRAVSRVKLALKKKENILIYGDYDVDGLTSTALLWQALFPACSNVFPFIPHRQKHGYGLKAEIINQLQSQKKLSFSLILAVDNGIVAHDEIKKLAADVIVIDHHLPASSPPPAYALLHSTSTSAAALSWLFARQFLPASDLSLAALGIVADCQPLLGPNRSFVFHGLKSLASCPSPGLKKLIELSSLKSSLLSTYDLSFVLAPRLNAAGRLSDPTDALRLLCAPTSRQASPLAHLLNQSNQKRQRLQQQALQLAYRQPINPSDKHIFISHPQFHPGIIGLLASQLSQAFNLPAIIISSAKNICRGSCRSIPQLNIIQTLRRFSPLFIDLGGHAAAAGFTISASKIPRLRRQLKQFISQKLKNTDLTPVITVDAPMTLSALKIKNIQAVNQLQPFGLNNPRPLFLFSSLKVVSCRQIGSDSSHLKLKLDDPSTSRLEKIPASAVAFKFGRLYPQLPAGSLVDIVASLDINTWGGISSPQLIIKEIIIK